MGQTQGGKRHLLNANCRGKGGEKEGLNPKCCYVCLVYHIKNCTKEILDVNRIGWDWWFGVLRKPDDSVFGWQKIN